MITEIPVKNWARNIFLEPRLFRSHLSHRLLLMCFHMIRVCLLLYCLSDVPSCIDCVTGKISKDGVDGAFICIVPVFKGIDHLMMGWLVVEMDKEWMVVFMMDVGYRPVLRPEIDTAITVCRV